MSDFIKLTKVTVAWKDLEPTTNIFAMKPDNIISLTETTINNIKCTEIEAVCNNGTIHYFVKESIDEILRKIDPLPYTDLESYIFNPVPLGRSCGNCKYAKELIDGEPCRSCDMWQNKWTLKEDQNENTKN